MYTVPIKDSTLARDMNSLGIIETDLSKVQAYKDRKAMINKATEAKHEAEILREEVNNMKSEMSEIKSMLLQLLQRNN